MGMMKWWRGTRPALGEQAEGGGGVEQKETFNRSDDSQGGAARGFADTDCPLERGRGRADGLGSW